MSEDDIGDETGDSGKNGDEGGKGKENLWSSVCGITWSLQTFECPLSNRQFRGS